MKLKTQAIKVAAPWALTLSTLTKLERAITAGESDAMEARWKFGRELLSHRKEYQGRMVIPADLMKLAIEKIGRSKTEVTKRVRFAEKFPDKKSMSNAVTHWPSWRQMIVVGLVDNTKKKPAKPKAAKVSHAGPWIIKRLTTEVDRAFTVHTKLTREEVADIEALAAKIKTLLDQIDRNDATQMSAVS